MKRKRFKKRIMSLGFSRNQAERFSLLANVLSESYDSAWRNIQEAIELRGPYGEEAAKCE